MIIIFSAKGTSWNSEIDPRLGRAEYLLVYNEEDKTIEAVNNSDIANEAQGAGPKTVQKIMSYNPDIIITGNGPGNKAAQMLMKTNIQIYVGAGNMTVEDAYKSFQTSQLEEFNY